MSDVVKTLVEAEIGKVKERFEALESQRQALIKNRSEIDQQISEATTEILRLQGEFRALENLQKASPGNGTAPASPTSADTVH